MLSLQFCVWGVTSQSISQLNSIFDFRVCCRSESVFPCFCSHEFVHALADLNFYFYDPFRYSFRQTCYFFLANADLVAFGHLELVMEAVCVKPYTEGTLNL